MPIIETVSIRRVVTIDSVGNIRPDRQRMTIQPEDGNSPPLFIPYAPSSITHSSIGSDYARIARAGRLDALVHVKQQLPMMSMTLFVADKLVHAVEGPNGYQVIIGSNETLVTLRRYAELGTRLRITYGFFENGLWRLTSLSIASAQRDPVTNEIRQADVEVEFTRVSDIVVGIGPVTGGVQPPPTTTPPAATPQTRTYTVKKGDTLWGISIRYYGTGTKWGVIADANGVRDPKKLQIGTVLRIP